MNFFKKTVAFCKDKTYIKYIASAVIIIILSALLTSLMLALTVIPFKWTLFSVLLSDILLFTVNALPIVLVMAAVYLLSGRIWISFSLTGLLAFLIAEINRFKIYFRDEPFVYSDIFLAKEAGKMMENYQLFLDNSSAIAISVIIVVTALAFFFLRGFNLRFNWKCITVRGVISILLVVLLALLGSNLYYKNTKVYVNTWHDEFGSVWSESANYSSRGVIYSFMRSISVSPVTEPALYSREEAKKIYEKYSDVMLPEDKKVNIISIMLEAYSDFSKYDSIEFEKDPYENFKKLKNDSYSGNLFTNVFAGGTIETERAFLMGISNPNLFKKNVNSYVRYFKDNGYYTEAMHPFYGWFYNRNNINRYLGFDSFLNYENTFGSIEAENLKEETYYDMISDTDLFEYIKSGYEAAVSRGQKYFNFTVTYQNHGPYHTYPITDKVILKYKDYYNEELYNEANNYFYGISRTDASLAALRKYIDSQTEPILLILFGDHMPGLSDSAYSMLGANIDLLTYEGAENYFETPYIFYANDAAKKSLGKDFEKEGETISPMFLMNELFEYIGIEGPAYLNYMSDVKKEYDVINHSFCARDGEFMHRWNMTDTAILNERQYIEYYLKNIPVKNS